MYNITLIGTIHQEFGNCNSNELYKILESISPEVIFDELPKHYFDMFFDDSFDKYCANRILLNQSTPIVPLEVKCVKKYKQNYDIKILPIDIDDIDSKLSEFQNEVLYLFSIIFKNEDYIKLYSKSETLIAQGGFHYLNSDGFLNYIERKEILEKNIIKSEIERYRLLDTYKLFHKKIRDDRENEMLQKIYEYSKENRYNQAVFLIGAEHRKSIMQKILEYEKVSEIKLNWRIFGDK